MPVWPRSGLWNENAVVCDELGFKRAVIWIAHHNGFHLVGPWHLCPWPVADPESLISTAAHVPSAHNDRKVELRAMSRGFPRNHRVEVVPTCSII